MRTAFFTLNAFSVRGNRLADLEDFQEIVMGYEQGDNTGYIMNGGGGGGEYDAGYDAVTYDFGGGDGFAVDYADFYGGNDLAPGTISPGGEAIAWGGDDFNYDYGAGGPIDYAPGFEPIPYAPYEPIPLEPPTFEPFPQSSFSEDLYFENLDYYLGQRYDDFTADQLAQQAATAGIPPPIEIGSEPMLLAPSTPVLPEIAWPYSTPLIPFNYGLWQTPPYVPTFPEPPAPPPPVTPTTTPKLPGYCPQGQYHPYPIGHPQQDVCVPFPAPTPTQQQQQRAPSQQPAQAPAQAPRPSQQQRQQQQQQQQPCPTGYKRDPWTQRCVPITPQRQQQQPTTRCATPGTVFDQATGRCVPVAQARRPLPGSEAPGTELPEGVGDLFSELKNLPWWLWLALAGLLLFGSQGEERKRVTVQHRRAS